jgi:UDP-N-acetylmuramate dehydrogenase
MNLADCTSVGLGGPACHLWQARSESEVLATVRQAKDLGLELCVLGGGSNLVVADRGVDAAVLRLSLDAIEVEEHADRVVCLVGAGKPWDDFVAFAVARGWAGIECLSGIPGQVGAVPIQNVGAYGQEVADTITRLRVLDRHSETVSWLSAAECEFGYRASRFKQREAERWLVLAVEFELSKRGRVPTSYPELERALAALGQGTPSLAQVRETVLGLRRSKSMLLDPGDENGRSCGSFFTNPMVQPGDVERITARAGDKPPVFPQPDGRLKVAAAWLIERAGLGRGTRSGHVGLSTRHTLALVAHDGATATELVRFAWHVRRRVEDEFGVRLLPEPVFWGFEKLDDGLPVIE